MSEALFTTVEAIEGMRREAGRRHLEFLRVPDLSAGLYRLEAGASDPQKPHAEDEVYLVVRGRSRFRVGTDERSGRGRCSSSRRGWSTASSTSGSRSRCSSSSDRRRAPAADGPCALGGSEAPPTF